MYSRAYYGGSSVLIFFVQDSRKLPKQPVWPEKLLQVRTVHGRNSDCVISRLRDSKKFVASRLPAKSIYRGSPLSMISLSTIPGIVRFKILLNSTNSLSRITFYVLSTSPCLVRFLNSKIPWEHKICTIGGPL